VNFVMEWAAMDTTTLIFTPVLEQPDLVAPAVLETLRTLSWAGEVEVTPIDPDLADTAGFSAAYGVALDRSANCVVVAGRRGERTTLAACVVLATTRADVNGLVRRRLDARKASFAAQAVAVEQSGMEYGGITPLGLPADWPLLIDEAVTRTDDAIIGSGIRGSKLRLPGARLAELPGAEVIAGLGLPG
jgi:prolyl-tRNA editing enzyme YbaK/EbsC (Cys-tRNA(Pro) deacylase)